MTLVDLVYIERALADGDEQKALELIGQAIQEENNMHQDVIENHGYLVAV